MSKLQKLHLAALSGNEQEVQTLLGKGVGEYVLFNKSASKFSDHWAFTFFRAFLRLLLLRV